MLASLKVGTYVDLRGFYGNAHPRSSTTPQPPHTPPPPPSRLGAHAVSLSMQSAAMTGGYRTVVKKSRDLGLDRVKKALEKENPLSKFELEFIRTSCRILDINSEDVIECRGEGSGKGRKPAKKGNGVLARPAG